MPIHEQLDLERNLTVFTVRDALAFDELFETLERVYARPEYTSRSLFDMRAAQAGGLSREQLKRLVGLIGKRRGDREASKWAIVAPQDVLFGVSRMFEAYATDLPVEVRVFHEIESAQQWLDGEDGDATVR